MASRDPVPPDVQLDLGRYEPRRGGQKAYRGRPIDLDVKDDDLQHAFRLFADVSGLNVVVFPGVHSRVTFKGRQRAVGPLPRPHPCHQRTFVSVGRQRPLDLAASGGATVVMDPTVRGDVVLKLNQVRWDQLCPLV